MVSIIKEEVKSMDWIDLSQLSTEDTLWVLFITGLWLLLTYVLMILIGHKLPWF